MDDNKLEQQFTEMMELLTELLIQKYNQNLDRTQEA